MTPLGVLRSVNLGAAEPNPYKTAETTGMGKHPHRGPVAVRAPGPRDGGLGSGLVGDHVGDRRHHGGDDQAVYAFPREDLDAWERRLGRTLPDGAFGENLTTHGLAVNEALLGERWRIGDVELTVTVPRIPCATFRGWMGPRDWLKTFTRAARPGTYLRVDVPGTLQAGERVQVVHRPEHAVTVALAFRAVTLEKHLLPELLAAGDDLHEELRDLATGRDVLVLDD